MTFLWDLVEQESKQQRSGIVKAQVELETELLARWIAKYCKERKLSVLPYAAVQRSCPNSIRKKGGERIDILMDYLFMTDYIREIYVDRKRCVEPLEKCLSL